MLHALDSADPLQQWLHGVGHPLMRAHTARASLLLERVFGEVAVQVGSFGPVDGLLRHARLPTRVLIAEAGADGDLQCHAEELALAERSVDLVLLPHTLEFAFDPFKVVREIERVLKGSGHVWISGMQPWSSYNGFGIYSPRQPLPLQRHVLTANRVAQWLMSLGMVIERVDIFSPSSKNILQPGPLREPLAGLYQLLAVKQERALTPMRGYRRRLLAPQGLGSLVSPSPSNVTHTKVSKPSV